MQQRGNVLTVRVFTRGVIKPTPIFTKFMSCPDLPFLLDPQRSNLSLYVHTLEVVVCLLHEP